MVNLAAGDSTIAARLNHFHHNTLEEFYDYENDPDALHNLIDDPQYADEITRHRATMKRFMEGSQDPVLEVFERRNEAAFVSDWVDRQQAESDLRRASKRKNQRQNPKLFRLDVPERATRGRSFAVTVRHRLPEKLGEQSIHVTLKDENGKRLERIVKTAAGNGRLVVTFQLPEQLETKTIQVAAFVGADYEHNMLHRAEGPVKVLNDSLRN